MMYMSLLGNALEGSLAQCDGIVSLGVQNIPWLRDIAFIGVPFASQAPVEL
jgi:hypothetical protein